MVEQGRVRRFAVVCLMVLHFVVVRFGVLFACLSLGLSGRGHQEGKCQQPRSYPYQPLSCLHRLCSFLHLRGSLASALRRRVVLVPYSMTGRAPLIPCAGVRTLPAALASPPSAQLYPRSQAVYQPAGGVTSLNFARFDDLHLSI